MDFGVVGLDHHHHHHHHHHNHDNNNNNNHGLGVGVGMGMGVSSSSSSEPGFASNNVISSSSSSDPETKQRTTLLYGSELSSHGGNKQERSAGSAALEEYWRSSKVAKTADDDFSSVYKGMMLQQRNNNNSASLLRSNSNTNSNSNNPTTTTTLSFLDNGSYNNHSQQHQMLSFSTTTSPTKPEAHHNNAATFPYFHNAYSAYTSRNTGYNNSINMHGGGGGGGGLMMRSGPFTASQWMELEHQALIYKYITANVPIPSNLLIPIRKAFDSAAAFSPALLRANPLGGGWGSSFHLGFSNNADPEPGRCRRTDGKKWRCSRDAVADQKYCERHMNRGRHRSRKPVEGPVAAGSNLNNSNNAAAASSHKQSATVAVASQPSLLASNALQSFAINNSSVASNRMFAKESVTTACSKEDASVFPRKQQPVQYDLSSREFGLVTSVDSLLNPLSGKPHRGEPPSHGSLHQFIDSWPDRTQLSISIPNAPPSAETNLSPLRLSSVARQAQWIPVSWEASSLGGPLGEALNQPSNNNNGVGSDHSKSTSSTPSSSVLNLMPEGAWDGSPPMGSSPTGVLQKTAFVSLSNSSAGSSPARAHEGAAALCVNIDLHPSAHHGTSSSLPSL